MMNRRLLISLFLIVTACDLVVEVDIPFEKKLVVNSVINPDSVWSAYITGNKHILDSLKHPHIDNAIVVIHENGTPVETLKSIGNGYYRSDNNTKPVAGRSYEIKVQAPGYEPVSASTFIPAPVQISNTEFFETQVNQWTSETTIKFSFLDATNEKNYYQIFVYDSDSFLGEDFQVVRSYWPVVVDYDDPSTIQEKGLDLGYQRGIFLKDILFDGKVKEITLKSSYNLGAAMRVEVRTISEDYYNYYVTSAIQKRTDSDPLAQPINVYCNVQNGFGIFAGYSASTVELGSDVRPVIVSASPMQASIGDVVTLTVDNLNLKNENDYGVVIFRAGFGGYTYASVRVKSENIVEFIVPHGALTGKIALNAQGLIGVSDFEFEVVE